jgi:aspartyl-tRNA(Asn)/glutamyl-tRNA(Gln) amidotransferase subunit A
MGSSTETSFFGATRNPWDLERVPGGSSGGSAAAVIADECIAALGSDTGGSIRQPASLCGVVGMKPTYGRVSRLGAITFGSSLDQVGPLTKDVEDCAIMMNVIAGYDALDSTSSLQDVPDYRSFLNQDIREWTIGIPGEYFAEGLDADVAAALKRVIQVVEARGGRIREISLPHTKYCIAVFCIVGTAEASSNLARYDGMQYGYRVEKAPNLMELYKQNRSQGFGAEVKRRVMLGTYALSAGYYDAYYKKASQVRARITEDFTEAFKTCDIILTPTTPTPAFKIGEKNADPLKMYLSDILTVSANLSGIPAISVPCGFNSQGLPIGAQFFARHFDEGKLLQIAHNYEKHAQLEKRRPNL